MPLVSFRNQLREAQRGRYAVPLFDVFEMRAVEGILETIEERRTPAILAIYAQYIDLPNAKAFSAFIRAMAEEATVPVSLMLDHGANVEQCIKALAFGFSDVMYDGSALPFEENIANTRLVARAAHALGAAVEGELGHVGRGADYQAFGSQRQGFTDPSLVERFVEQSGVDCLAIAIGNAHGLYKGEPHLDLDLLAEIRRRVAVPLVLHGGTGLSEEQFRAAIAGGIAKINISTDIKIAATRMTRAAMRPDDPTFFYFMNDGAKQAYKERSAYYLQLFGTSQWGG